MKGLIVGLLVGIIFCLFMVNKEVKITEQKTFENISNTIDSSLSRISNTVDSIIGNKEFEQVIDTPKTLTFAMYMPDNGETYMGMSIDEFYSIKTLVMQRSLMLDSGCISYFQYIRECTLCKNNHYILGNISHLIAPNNNIFGILHS